MAVSGYGERVAVVAGGRRLTYEGLAAAAAAGAAAIRSSGADALVYVGPNHVAFPVALFSASAAGVPFIPLNYRLGTEQLEPLVTRHPGALVVAETLPLPGAAAERSTTLDAFVESLGTDVEPEPSPAGPDDLAVLLYTSGTSGVPKGAILRHRHLTAYVFSTVEFGGAGEEEAALVTVPPYHIAGLANLLSNVYAGRRIVYLETFDPATWLSTVRSENITQAMVVPTMLARIIRYLDGEDAAVPTLRTLSYGGSRTPLPVLEEALVRFGGTGFVN